MANKIELSKMNRNIVYRTMLNKGVVSVQDIAQETGLSVPTVNNNINALIKSELVETIGTLESTGGRRATGYRCISEARYSVGIDITQNHITIAVVNLAPKIVCISQREKFKFVDSDKCYQNIYNKLEKLLTNNKIDKDRILGIGVSLPCIVDQAKGTVIYDRLIKAPVNVRDKLQQWLPYNVRIFNDANSAGYGELFSIQEKMETIDSSTVFYLMLSNSVGGAEIYNGSIILGDNYRAGEIGHVKIVQKRGKTCYCGQKGCVNAYCSARNLSDLTNGMLEDFFALLESGDEAAQKAFEEYLGYLTTTIVNIRMMFDGDIILGGYVGSYLDHYIDDIRTRVVILDPYDDDAMFVKTCNLKEEASCAGAAMDFINRYISEI